MKDIFYLNHAETCLRYALEHEQAAATFPDEFRRNKCLLFAANQMDEAVRYEAMGRGDAGDSHLPTCRASFQAALNAL